VGVDALEVEDRRVVGGDLADRIGVVVVVVGDAHHVPITTIVAVEDAVAAGVDVDDRTGAFESERRVAEPRDIEAVVLEHIDTT
jgi:hypothetical protein